MGEGSCEKEVMIGCNDTLSTIQLIVLILTIIVTIILVSVFMMVVCRKMKELDERFLLKDKTNFDTII